jgi:hypothetical protein
MGERYLVSYRGESDWALNLEVARRARLSQRRRVEEIAVIEVPVGERAPLLEVYSERLGKLPTVARVLSALPTPPITRSSGSPPRR